MFRPRFAAAVAVAGAADPGRGLWARLSLIITRICRGQRHAATASSDSGLDLRVLMNRQ